MNPMNRIALAAVATAGFAVIGCAKDPAADAPSATVAPPTPEPEAEAPPAEAAPKPAETLAFSNETSTIGWVGSKVTRSHRGGFGEFSGELVLEPSNPTASSVSLTIQTASLTSDTDDLTKHLKSKDFFDVENIPTATFESTSIEAGGQGDATHTISGELTLHGVTKAVSFPATIEITEQEATAKAEFSINRQDFGISFPGMPDDLIRDGVVIELDIHAPRTTGEVAAAAAASAGDGEDREQAADLPAK